MILVFPWAPTKADEVSIEHTAGALVGQSILAVRYLEPISTDQTKRDAHDGFDQVHMGVELAMTHGVITLRWLMKEFKEGLAMVVAGSRDYAVIEGLKPIDVTEMPEWRVRRSAVTAVALGWQMSEANEPPTVWSVRLNFENQQSVTFALGVSGDWNDKPGINYLPDTIVVIFKPELAQGYRHPAGAHPPDTPSRKYSWSAWGDPI